MTGRRSFPAVAATAFAIAVVALSGAPVHAAAVSEAAPAVAAAPVRVAENSLDVNELQRRLDELMQEVEAAKQRDLLAPELRIDAPEEVDAADEAYHLSGFVGDDREGPKLFLDGQPVTLMAPGDGAPDLGAFTYAFDVEVAIAGEADNHHVIEAEDAEGNPVAEEVVVRVVARNVPKFRGKYHALIIGNGVYEQLPPAETAEADARALAELLNRRYVFDKENTSVLLNATRRDILGWFSTLRKTLKKNDRLLIYYTGHSYYDAVTGEGFWQARDADAAADFTWVAVDDVRRNLKGMIARHVMVIADGMFPLAVERGATRAERDRFFEEIDSYASRKMIAAGVLTPTPDAASGRHSAFAYSLLRVLEENQEPYITSKQLFDRLSRELAGNPDYNPEWGTVSDAGDEGSGEFTFILRAKPLAADE